MKRWMWLILMVVAALTFAGCGDDSSSGGDDNDTLEDTAGDAATDMIEGDPDLVLNEVLANDPADGPDWVELVNLGDGTADLTGWTVTDGSDNAGPVLDWTVAPGAHSVIWWVAADGALGQEDCVRLHDPEGTLVDETCWFNGASEDGRTWGRFPDGTGDWEPVTPTPETANEQLAGCGNGTVDADEACDGDAFVDPSCEELGFGGGSLTCVLCSVMLTERCEPASGDIVINEVSSTEDAVELYNTGSAAVQLLGYQISDRLDPTERAYFLGSTTLEPGQYAVVTFTDTDPFRLGGEEEIVLRDDTGTIIDHVAWKDGEAEVSYCRTPDGSGEWGVCAAATFGAAN